MASEGAVRLGDLLAMPIDEALSTVEALGYVLAERGRAIERATERSRAFRPRR